MTANRGGNIFGGALFAAVGLLALGGAWWMGNSQYTILTSWPTVDAEVTKSEIAESLYRETNTKGPDKTYPVYQANLEFRFVTSGQETTAQSASDQNANLREIQSLKENYAPGTRHTIRYNPANPHDIRFNAGYTFRFFTGPIILGVLGLAFTGAGLATLKGALSSKP